MTGLYIKRTYMVGCDITGKHERVCAVTSVDRYLELRSEPERHNRVFVELSPDVEHRHDQRDHQQLVTT